MSDLVSGLRPAALVAGRFRLERELGRGGMGAVWLAQHVELHVPCAIKFILMGDTGQARARFDREAKAAAQLRSPHVVSILDYGTWEGLPYLAMEFLEGEDLRHRLDRMQRIPPVELFTLMEQVARGLSKAHQAGIVHRDLKPDNIFLVRDDGRDLVKLLDFGVAKVAATEAQAGLATQTGMMLGTPFYMSPEQAQGNKQIDHRSDLFSLAVIIFEALIGRRPFDSDALGDLLMKIIVQPLPVPTEIAPWVGPGFDAWWARAASRDPAGRFGSVQELVAALGEALGVAAAPGRVSGVGAPPQVVPSSMPAQPVLAATNGALSSTQPPSKGKGTLVAIALGGLAVVGLGVGALVAMGSKPPTAPATPAATPAGADPSPAVAAPAASSADTAPAVAPAAPSSSAATKTAAAPAHKDAHGKDAAPPKDAAAPPKPPGAKPKADMGF